MSEEAAEQARDENKRPYTLGEEIANSAIHGLGVGLAIAALTALVIYASGTHDGYKLAAALVYGISLVLEYAASTMYHSFPMPRVKHVFKVLDHCGIYLLIAGTYTPFCLVVLRDSRLLGIEHVGWWLFGLVWTLAVGGISLEAFWAYRPRWLSAAVYLALGWIVVLAIRPLVSGIEPGGVGLLVAGGLAYTLGTVFYVLKRVPYMHAVWHVWVLAGSILHFLAVVLYVIL